MPLAQSIALPPADADDEIDAERTGEADARLDVAVSRVLLDAVEQEDFQASFPQRGDGALRVAGLLQAGVGDEEGARVAQLAGQLAEVFRASRRRRPRAWARESQRSAAATAGCSPECRSRKSLPRPPSSRFRAPPSESPPLRACAMGCKPRAFLWRPAWRAGGVGARRSPDQILIMSLSNWNARARNRKSTMLPSCGCISTLGALSL